MLLIRVQVERCRLQKAFFTDENGALGARTHQGPTDAEGWAHWVIDMDVMDCLLSMEEAGLKNTQMSDGFYVFEGFETFASLCYTQTYRIWEVKDGFRAEEYPALPFEVTLMWQPKG